MGKFKHGIGTQASLSFSDLRRQKAAAVLKAELDRLQYSRTLLSGKNYKKKQTAKRYRGGLYNNKRLELLATHRTYPFT